MALSPERQSALNSLSELLKSELPEMNKSTMASLQKAGISNSLVGGGILRKNTADLYKKLLEYTGQLNLQQANANEATAARKESQEFTSTENEKNRKWQEAIMNWQIATQKSMQPSSRTKSRQALQSLLPNLLIGAATGGFAPSLFGTTNGVNNFSNLQATGLGALFGGTGVTGIATQKLGMQQLLEMFKNLK